jgi:hypothetical protein
MAILSRSATSGAATEPGEVTVRPETPMSSPRSGVYLSARMTQ